MTREVFLNDLKNALSGMDEEEISSVLAYYSEMIDDRVEAGMSEEDAVNAMEPVKTIASRVLSEAGVVEEKIEEKESPDKEIRKSAEMVRELHIMAEDQRVHLMTGDTDEIVLRYRIEDGDIYQLHEENGVLTLEHTDRPVSSYKFEGKITAENFFDEVGKFLGSINLGNLFKINVNAKPRCIEVILPRVFKGKVKVKTSNARIEANDVTCLDEVKFTTGNARVIVNHLVAHSLTVATSNGRVMLEDVYVREELSAATSNGRICAQNVTSDQALFLKTSNGFVKTEDVDAKKIVIRTSNGSVSGVLKGRMEDYAITGSTSNGKNNLTDSETGERQLTIKTSNGNINMEFSGC